MTEDAKAARREYMRKWAKEHPEKVKEYQARHWKKVAEAMIRKNEEDHDERE